MKSTHNYREHERCCATCKWCIEIGGWEEGHVPACGVNLEADPRPVMPSGEFDRATFWEWCVAHDQWEERNKVRDHGYCPDKWEKREDDSVRS